MNIKQSFALTLIMGLSTYSIASTTSPEISIEDQRNILVSQVNTKHTIKDANKVSTKLLKALLNEKETQFFVDLFISDKVDDVNYKKK